VVNVEIDPFGGSPLLAATWNLPLHAANRSESVDWTSLSVHGTRSKGDPFRKVALKSEEIVKVQKTDVRQTPSQFIKRLLPEMRAERCEAHMRR
jgi:hypothetical protein